MKKLENNRPWKHRTLWQRDDLADSEGLDDMKIVNNKPQVAPSVFPVGLSTFLPIQLDEQIAPLIKQFMQLSRF